MTRLEVGVTILVMGLGASCASLPERAAPGMVVVPIESALFVPVVPHLPEGPQMAVLWGDPKTGPSAVLLEMKKGAVPLHVHTANYHLVVLEGVMKHWDASSDEASSAPLGPGSYWFQPGGEAHGDSCLTDICRMHIVWSGARDGRLAGEP